MFCTSVSLSVFLLEQPHQTEQDGSRHHQQTNDHRRRNREVNAGLDDGRVDDAHELLRRDVGFVNGERDCLVGSGIAVQRAGFADQIAAWNEIISAYNAVFIGNQLSNERPLVVIQTEANAGKRITAANRFPAFASVCMTTRGRSFESWFPMKTALYALIISFQAAI